MPGGFDGSAAAGLVPCFRDGTEPSTLPGAVFGRGYSDEGGQFAGMVESGEVPDFRHPGDGVDQGDPTETHEGLDEAEAVPLAGLLFERGGDSFQACCRILGGLDQFLEGDLLGRKREPLTAQVVEVLSRPGGGAGIASSIAQEKALDALTTTAQVLDGRKANAHEIPDGFIGFAGDGDIGEFTGPEETGQSDGVTTVRFDPIGGTFWNERGADDLADNALAAKVAAEGKSRGPGLVDVTDLATVGGEALVQFVEGVGMSGDVTVRSDLACGVCDAYGDGFGVRVEADVFKNGLGG